MSLAGSRFRRFTEHFLIGNVLQWVHIWPRGFVDLCCNWRVIAFGLLRKFMMLDVNSEDSLMFVGSILLRMHACDCVATVWWGWGCVVFNVLKSRIATRHTKSAALDLFFVVL